MGHKVGHQVKLRFSLKIMVFAWEGCKNRKFRNSGPCRGLKILVYLHAIYLHAILGITARNPKDLKRLVACGPVTDSKCCAQTAALQVVATCGGGRVGAM